MWQWVRDKADFLLGEREGKIKDSGAGRQSGKKSLSDMEKKKDLGGLWVAEQGHKAIVEMTENSDFVACKSKSSSGGLYPSMLTVGSVLDNTYFKVSVRSPETTWKNWVSSKSTYKTYSGKMEKSSWTSLVQCILGLTITVLKEGREKCHHKSLHKDKALMFYSFILSVSNISTVFC